MSCVLLDLGGLSASWQGVITGRRSKIKVGGGRRAGKPLFQATLSPPEIMASFNCQESGGSGNTEHRLRELSYRCLKSQTHRHTEFGGCVGGKDGEMKGWREWDGRGELLRIKRC